MNWIIISYFNFLISSYCHAQLGEDSSRLKFHVVDSEAEFQDECINSHNEYRQKHNAPDLKSDKELVKKAKIRCPNIAENIQRKNPFKTTGENRMNWYDFNGIASCPKATEIWYEQNQDYNFDEPNPKDKEKYNAFTQLVWKSTKRVGCARCTAEHESITYTHIVCNYEPRGNAPNKFKENVS